MEEKVENKRIVILLKENFGEDIVASREFREELSITVTKEKIGAVCRFLCDTKELEFSLLRFITAVDYPEREPRFDIIYQLYSIPQQLSIRLKLAVNDGEPATSVCSIWNAALFHERLVFDMFGIKFEGHPDLRRIYLPDGWEGHPLRKDYPLEGEE